MKEKSQLIESILNGDLPVIEEKNFKNDGIYTLAEIYSIARYNGYVTGWHLMKAQLKAGLIERSAMPTELIPNIADDTDFQTDWIRVNDYKYYKFDKVGSRFKCTVVDSRKDHSKTTIRTLIPLVNL